MKKIKHFILLFVIIFYADLVQSNEDLIELNCSNETQCKQFEHSGIKCSCVEDQCRCNSSSGELVKCQPLNSKLNNIIGGSCPCTIPNAECGPEHKVCYCRNEFIPSRDKRRCIPHTVALEENCEDSSQCQRTDFNAICHKSSKTCKCMDQFINYEGVCVSVLGNKLSALNSTQCLEKFGDHTLYNSSLEQCICMSGYFASIDNTRCLKVSKYLESCTENLQCIGTMGPGGMCSANVCKCSAKYFVEEKKSNEEAANRSVCTPVVERGQYCRYDADCYQHHLGEWEQSLHCKFGECNCKEGFNSFNESGCIKGSGAGEKSLMKFHLICIVCTIVMLWKQQFQKDFY